jgi:hypothetical protein
VNLVEWLARRSRVGIVWHVCLSAALFAGIAEAESDVEPERTLSTLALR